MTAIAFVGLCIFLSACSVIIGLVVYLLLREQRKPAPDPYQHPFGDVPRVDDLGRRAR